jgi:hypothetical protein
MRHSTEKLKKLLDGAALENKYKQTGVVYPQSWVELQ